MMSAAASLFLRAPSHPGMLHDSTSPVMRRAAAAGAANLELRLFDCARKEGARTVGCCKGESIHPLIVVVVDVGSGEISRKDR